MKRRRFINNITLSTIGLGVFGCLYSWQIEPFWLEFVYHKMIINNLPIELKGKTLMQISDIHVGDRFDYKFIIKSFHKAQEKNPDFVVYTGDFITYDNVQQFEQLKDTLKYAVKGKLGTLAILGNHDYGKNWSDQFVAEKVVDLLNSNDISVLRNEQMMIGGLNFIGFDDYWALNFNPLKVMKYYNSEKANIVLCHNPDVCDLNVWNGYQGWILSGHTHGGQVKPPFLDPPILPVKNENYSSGRIDLGDGRMLYINRALGHLWQVRFNVRPEVTIFNLA